MYPHLPLPLTSQRLAGHPLFIPVGPWGKHPDGRRPELSERDRRFGGFQARSSTIGWIGSHACGASLAGGMQFPLMRCFGRAALPDMFRIFGRWEPAHLDSGSGSAASVGGLGAIGGFLHQTPWPASRNIKPPILSRMWWYCDQEGKARTLVTAPALFPIVGKVASMALGSQQEKRGEAS